MRRLVRDQKRGFAPAGRRYLISCASALRTAKVVQQAKAITPLLFVPPIPIEVTASGLNHLDRFA
jgi:hypothetical protein